MASSPVHRLRVVRRPPVERWALVFAVSCKFLTPLDEREYAGGSGTVSVLLDDSACSAAGCGRATAAFVEIGTYPGSCPVAVASDPANTLVEKLLAAMTDADEVTPGTATPPPLPQPPAGPRAYFALSRDPQCGIIGWGCTDVAFTNQTEVTVALQPASDPRLGACLGGSCACSSGALDAGAEAGGVGRMEGGTTEGGCSLALLSAGALPPPMQAGDVLAGPGVVATDQGFAIAIREQWSSDAGSTSAVRTFLLRPDGTLRAPPPANVTYYDDTCSGPIADDGVGIAYQPGSNAGVIAVSEPPCGKNGAGASFFPFAGDATLLPGRSFNSAGTGPDLMLARQHAVAAGSAGGAFELAYVSAAAAYDALVADGAVRSAVGLPTPSASFAALSTTAGLQVQVVGTTSDAGWAAEVYSGAVGGMASRVGEVLGAELASLAASDGGALVAAVTDAGLVLQALDPTGRAIGSSPAAGPDGAFASVDVAATGDLAAPFAVAVGGPRSVSVVLVDSMAVAASPPAPLTTQPVLTDLLASFSGVHLALAAGQGELAVVWLSDHLLRAADAAGGWALLACR
jgi:hypothetical protein